MSQSGQLKLRKQKHLENENPDGFCLCSCCSLLHSSFPSLHIGYIISKSCSKQAQEERYIAIE